MINTNPSPAINHIPGHVKHTGHNMTGFIIFLLSESIIFLAFFSGYIILKITAPIWYPPGVDSISLRDPLVNTVILVSSSFVIYYAEKALHDKKLWNFRFIWLATIVMGLYFVYGQYIEWGDLEFTLQDGSFAGMFYLLTGFHGLHVIIGICLMALMLYRSFLGPTHPVLGSTSPSSFRFLRGPLVLGVPWALPALGPRGPLATS